MENLVSCRICLKEINSEQIFTTTTFYDNEKGSTLTTNDCLEIFVNLNIIERISMCGKCISELEFCYEFYKNLLRSQCILQQKKDKKKMEEVKEDQIENSVCNEDSSHELYEEERLVDQFDCLSNSAKDQNIDCNTNCNRLKEVIADAETSQYIDTWDLEEHEDDTIEEMCIEKLESWNDEKTIYPNHRQTSNESSDTEIKPRQRFYGKFFCDICDKLFVNHSRMLLHRRSHEPDRPKFACNDCGRMYVTNQALEVHIRAAHKMMGFSCKICSKVFPNEKSLIVHLRYHTGEFPYVCETCGLKFAQQGHLNTHQKVKHNSVRFCCQHPNCGKFFTSSASLRNHEFSHGLMPFECEFCQRGYPAKAKLKAHISRVHKQNLSLEELETMQRFHIMRSKPNAIQVEV